MADLSDPISPLQDAEMQIYNSHSGCRNADLQLFLRLQEYRCQDVGMILLGRGDGILTYLP
jgi:hypothetical protein